MVTWVGASVVFKGDLSSSEDMTIDGRVEGTVKLADRGLTIGPNAEIRADIVAETVTVRGAVTGTITAGDKVVEGDVMSGFISWRRTTPVEPLLEDRVRGLLAAT
jgi:cytoskeletal protein CcmA (bactofilin family)